MHGRPRFAKLSVDDDLKVTIAAMHPDFDRENGSLSLMEIRWLMPHHWYAHGVRGTSRASSTTVLPASPSCRDRLSNRWCDLLLFVVQLLSTPT
jgi:hypothetical protein